LTASSRNNMQHYSMTHGPISSTSHLLPPFIFSSPRHPYHRPQRRWSLCPSHHVGSAPPPPSEIQWRRAHSACGPSMDGITVGGGMRTCVLCIDRQRDGQLGVLREPGKGKIGDRVHCVKTSNRSRNICNRPLTPVTCTHICNGCCLVPVTYKRVRTTPGLASTTPVTNVDFW
jgi:hypothetical protein